MAEGVQKVEPIVGMDFDSIYERVKRGMYLRGHNIRPLGQDDNQSDAQNIILGNTEKFHLADVVAQNEVMRFFFTVDPLVVQHFDVGILDWNNSPLASPVTVTTTAGNVTTTIGDFITAISTNLTTRFQTFSFDTIVIETGNLSGYVDLTITTVMGRGYISLYSYSIGSDDTEFYSRVVKEAVSNDEAGTPVMIGGKEILGRAYSFWATQANMPTKINDETNPIVSITNNGAGLIRITFTNPMTLVDGDAITISNIIVTAGVINGFWIVDQVSTTIIDLLGSDFTTIAGLDFTNATILQYSFGYSLIHATERDENTQVYKPNNGGLQGAVVLRTKELDFRIPKQIDCDMDETNKYDIYFTDFYNTIRAFYYKGAIMDDGAIHVINPDGQYAYGSIDLASTLIVTQPKIGFSFTGQLQTGGNILAGNHRNAVRLITRSGGSSTLWTVLGNDIPVYAHDFNESVCEYVVGDNSLKLCTKINQFHVTGLDTDVYQYIELADVLYSNGAVSAIIVSRFAITSSEMDIQYTGYENDTEKLDATELSRIQAAYKTAKNIRILDNRLVLSNLTTDSPYDLSGWALLTTHELFKKALDNPPNANGLVNDFFQPEFSSPLNVNEFVGYMQNDNYRFGQQVRWKDAGQWSDVYFTQDITFNTDAAYPRRTATFANYDLTEALVIATAGVNDQAATARVLVPAIRFSYNVNYILPDGKRLGDVIDGVRFVRCECIPEVIASGLIAQTIYGDVLAVPPLPSPSFGYSSDDQLTLYYGEYPLIAYPAVSYPDSDPLGLPFTIDAVSKRLCSFYSPDIIFGRIPVKGGDGVGDQLIIINSALTQHMNTHLTGGHSLQSGFRYLDSSNALDTATQIAKDIDESAYILGGQIASIAGVAYRRLLYLQDNSNPALGNRYWWNMLSAPVFHVTTDIAPDSGGFGLQYAQWFRSIPNKYGNAANSKYVSTGSQRDITSLDIGTLSDDVYGGDTFTQHQYIKHQYPVKFQLAGAPSIPDKEGGNGAMRFITQNRVNSQLRLDPHTVSAQTVFPNAYESLNDAFNLIEQIFVEGAGYDYTDYSSSYDIGLSPVTYIGFDSLVERISIYLARVAWSVLKPQGSLSDLFREFQPLDFHDLESKYGGIFHHEVVNGELMTLQPLKWMRQYFNTRGTLQVKNAGEVLIGDGSVMSRDGVELSAIGCRNKWSVIKGKAKGGGDCLYWICADYKKVMRFGRDGSRPISDMGEGDMQTFFANFLRFIYDFDTPAFNYGICGVWDDRNNEVVWTVMGQYQAEMWVDTTTYGIGTIIKYNPPFLTYEKTGELYIALTDSNTGNQPDESPDDWELIPHDNPNYYNEFTIAFSEKNNRFTSFYTPKPKIYLKYKSTYLTPDPIHSSHVYENNVGDYAEWYVGDDEDAHLRLVFAGDGDLMKTFHAIAMNMELAPSRVDFYTKNHHAFILNGDPDMESLGDLVAAAVKNDIISAPNGTSNEDTDKPNGTYLIVDITMPHGIYNRIESVDIKSSPLERIYLH